MLGGLISGTIGGLYNIASGIFSKAKANRLAKQSVRPIYTAPGEIAQNQELARNAAQNGMSATEYNNQLNNINTNEAAGLNTLSTQRNSLAGVGNIVAQSNAADMNLNAQDDAVKRQNLQNLYSANSQAADYADKAFQYNKADKYAQEQNIISQLRGQGNASVNSGVSSLGNLAQSYFLNNQTAKG
jgi:hypothetical protein